MKVTITVKSKSPLIPDVLLDTVVLDLMSKGAPLPEQVARDLKETGRAVFQNEWIEANYEMER